MDQFLELSHSENDYDILDVDLQMLPSWLVLNHSSKCIHYLLCFFINTEDKNLLSQITCHIFLYIWPTKATVELANGNTVYSQLVGVALCHLTKYSIIYLVVQVYCFPSRPSNTTSLLLSIFMLVFKRLHLNLLNIVIFYPRGHSWRSTYHTKKNVYYLWIEICQVQPSEKQEYCGSNCLCPIRTESPSAYSPEIWSCLNYQTKPNVKKSTHEGSPKKSLWIVISLTYLFSDQVN